jgi:hypothetical protein
MTDSIAVIDQEAVGNSLPQAQSTEIEIKNAPVYTDDGKLTEQDQADLRRYENTISQGKDTFLKVGKALAAICDRHLYRENYSTFAEYCSKKWGFSAKHGYRLIKAAETCDDLSSMDDIEVLLPRCGREARAYEGLSREQKHTVNVEATKKSGGKAPSAKVIEQEAAQFKRARPTDRQEERKIKTEKENLAIEAKDDGYTENDRVFLKYEDVCEYLRDLPPGTLNKLEKRNWLSANEEVAALLEKQ